MGGILRLKLSFLIIVILAAISPGCIGCLSPGEQVKSHTILGSSDGDLSGYQVLFMVHSGTGTDNGENVYLDGHALNWPNDMRFTDGAGSPLSYWTESHDASNATVWVNVDSIPAYPGTATIKLYYGKAGEGSASNGTATFPLFDDFSGSSLNTTDTWISRPATASVTGGILSLAGNNAGNVMSRNAYGAGYALESKVSVTNTANTDNFIGFSNTSPLVSLYTGAFGTWGSADWTYDGNYVKGDTGVPLSTGWIRLTSMRGADGSSIGMINQSGHYVGKIDSTPYPISIHHYGKGATQVDWVAVRKYTAHEPAHGAWS